jgi:hypothetical protein
MKYGVFITECITRAIGLGCDANYSRQATGQGVGCAHHKQIVSQGLNEAFAMRRIRGAQTQIHQIHMVRAAPLQRSENHSDVRCESMVKHFDREQFGVRRLLSDRSRHRRPMAQTVDIVLTFAAARNFNAPRDFSHMRVAGMNTAIYNGDSQS